METLEPRRRDHYVPEALVQGIIYTQISTLNGCFIESFEFMFTESYRLPTLYLQTEKENTGHLVQRHFGHSRAWRQAGGS